MASHGINLRDLDQRNGRRISRPSNPSAETGVLHSEPHLIDRHRSSSPQTSRGSPRLATPPNNHHSTEQSHQPLVLDDDSPGLHNYKNTAPIKGKLATYFAVLAWWKPELFASFLSIASFVSIIVVLCIYDGVVLTEVNLPSSLSLNSVIAALATVNRACLNTPVCSALFQQMWLYLAQESREERSSRCRLRDLELYADASTGAWGSLVFLYKARVSRSVPHVLFSSSVAHMLTFLNQDCCLLWLHNHDLVAGLQYFHTATYIH